MSEFEELARRVERHWAEESRNALERDTERVRRLVEGAMASSRAGTGASSAVPLWMKGIGLCVVAVAAGLVEMAVYDGGPCEVTPAEQQPSPALDPRVMAPPPTAAPVEVSTTAVADLPKAVLPKLEASASPPPSAVRPSLTRAAHAEVHPAATALSPAELFARANEKRRRTDLRAAEADYRLLIDQMPSSREALLSHVILGRMIEDREPAAALALFDRYLELGGGGLAEEARTSRARLLSKLGKRHDAARAWRELLERHPDTVHRTEAEAALRSTEPAVE